MARPSSLLVCTLEEWPLRRNLTVFKLIAAAIVPKVVIRLPRFVTLCVCPSFWERDVDVQG